MNFYNYTRFALLLLTLTASQTSRAASESEKSYARHAFLWQAGWTAAFSSSLIFNGIVATSRTSSREERFDSKLSILTSGSGFLSVAINSLPVAYASEDEWTANPELLRLTELEVQRRRGPGHIAFMLTEQVLVASAIGIYDKRPIDAWRRLGIGTLTSLAFAFSTPSKRDGIANVQLRYDGLAFHAGLQWNQ